MPLSQPIKTKPIMSWSRAFSRPLSSLIGFSLSSHWLSKVVSLALRHLIEKRSINSNGYNDYHDDENGMFLLRAHITETRLF